MAEENVQSEQSEDQGQSTQSDDQVEDQGVEKTEEVQSDESTQEGETEDQGSKEEAVFMSKDDVPDELKPAYERMQKAFTSKMQGISQDKKDAQAYRELMEKELQNAQARPQPKEQKEQLANDLGVDMNNLTSEQKATLDWLNNYVEQQVHQYMQPINQQFVQDRTKAELKEVREKYGEDFTTREPEIAEIIRKNPGLNFDQAFKVLTYDEQVKKGVEKAYASVESKKKAKTVKSSPSSAVAESPNLDDMASIFKSAKRQHGYS